MDLKEKQLLLADLCARLPYGVKINREWISPMSGSPEHSTMEFDTSDIEIIKTSIELGKEGNYRGGKMKGLTICDDGKNHFVRGYMCKPYLRPMSSMTEEEIKELSEIDQKRLIFSARHLTWHLDGEVIDYMNKKMFDWRGLIHLGLAIDCTNMGIYD